MIVRVSEPVLAFTGPPNVAPLVPMLTVELLFRVVEPVTANVLLLVRYVLDIVTLPLYCWNPAVVTSPTTMLGAVTVNEPVNVIGEANVMVLISWNTLVPPVTTVTVPPKSLPAPSVIVPVPAVRFVVPVTPSAPVGMMLLPPLLAIRLPVMVP